MTVRQGLGIVSVAALLGGGFALVVVRDRIAARDAHDIDARVNDDVLIFDDGYDGIVALDIATQVVTRRPVPGQTAGDQPFRSLLVGTHLVVGAGEISAAPLAGGMSRRLGSGVAVPANEPGAVWLTSYGGVHTPTERLVNMRGTILLEGPTPRDDGGPYAAAAGVRGGLVFETPDGLAIWDARTGKIVRRIGGPGSLPGPAYGSTLAWSARCATGLELTSVADARTRHVPVPDGTAGFRSRDATFSPDGTRLAVPVEVDAGRTDVVIVDVGIAAITARLSGWSSPVVSVAWSPDGKRLYVAPAAGVAPDDSRLVVYDVATETQLDIGPQPNGAAKFVVVGRDVTRGMLKHPSLVTPDACRPPVMQPSGRTRACAFQS